MRETMRQRWSAAGRVQSTWRRRRLYLVGREKGGLTPAFADVAREHLPGLYSLARRLVGDEAEDLVQTCLLKAFRAYDDLRDPDALRAWFTSILVNCARDRYRSQGREPATTPLDEVEEFSLYRQIADEDPFPYSDSLHVDFLCNFGPEDVWAVLRGLPPLYRFPLVLVHMEDLATKHVARMLNVPLGTLLARLHRGRKLFERALWDHAVHNDLLKEPPVGAMSRRQ
jgi:RNA polymerase sigma-70 factor, ECF subfamily